MSYTPVTLTPAQANKWDMTRTRLLWHAPYFSYILYHMLGKDKVNSAEFTTELDTYAATDGASVTINPDQFFGLELQEQTFVLAHEILHCVLAHCETIHVWRKAGAVALPDHTSLPYNHDLMNMACDYVINAILVEANIGKMPEAGCYDPKVAKGMDSTVDVYAKLYKQQKQKPQPQSLGFDLHLPPGSQKDKNPDTAASDRRADAEWPCAIAAAMQAAKVRGTLPASIERLLGQVIEVKTDWRDHMEAWFARKTGAGSYNWRRPDRIFISRAKPIFVPARQTSHAGTIIAALDTSGSVGARELTMFFANLSKIMEDVRPERLIAVWCDAVVHQVDILEDMADIDSLRSRKVGGGGGTDFCPVFARIDKEGWQPDALVYLTDGYGQFPDHMPDYPVVWGSLSRPNEVAYPFGDVVDIR